MTPSEMTPDTRDIASDAAAETFITTKEKGHPCAAHY